MKLKTQFQFALIFVVAAGCLGGAGWLYFKGRKTPPSAAVAFDAKAYQDAVVVRYQEKSQLITSILQQIKAEDANIRGIQAHIPSWKALTAQDASEIEELNSHLDTWFSGHLDQVQSKIGKNTELKSLMTKLSKLDQTISGERARLLSAKL